MARSTGTDKISSVAIRPALAGLGECDFDDVQLLRGRSEQAPPARE